MYRSGRDPGVRGDLCTDGVKAWVSSDGPESQLAHPASWRSYPGIQARGRAKSVTPGRGGYSWSRLTFIWESPSAWIRPIRLGVLGGLPGDLKPPCGLRRGPVGHHNNSKVSDPFAKNLSVSPQSNGLSFSESSLTPCRAPRLWRGFFPLGPADPLIRGRSWGSRSGCGPSWMPAPRPHGRPWGSTDLSSVPCESGSPRHLRSISM